MEKKLDKEIAQSSFDLLNKLQGDSEPIYDDDLEVNNPAFIKNGKRLRAVLIPEKL